MLARSYPSELHLLLGLVLTVEAQTDALPLHLGDEVAGPPPDGLEVPERLARVVWLEVLPVVLVGQEQLAPVVEVAVHHLDDRLAEVGELAEELVLHLAELAVEDLPAVPLLVEAVDEQLLLDRELGSEERVDEGDVVVVLADLEDLLPAEAQVLVPGAAGLQVVTLVPLLAEPSLVPPLLDVPVQLDAELVGVERAGAGAEGAGVVVRVVDDLVRGQRLPGHDRGVPVAGPPLVHDLRLALGREVVGLLAEDGEHVELPRLERRVLQEEEQHVPLRPLG